MAPFAQDTGVPVGRTRGEIEALLEKHGAENFGTGWVKDKKAGITFSIQGRMVRFELPLPANEEAITSLKQRGGNYKYATPTDVEIKNWTDRESRRRWRCLHLAIKAKLEAVATKIFTFEEEFLSHIVTYDNLTIYEALKRAENGKGQRLLPPVGKGPIEATP